MFGRLCHGRDRRPLEPYGVVAPFLRMAACLALFIASACALALMALDVADGPSGVALVLANACVTALSVALVARFAAAIARPDAISLTAWDTEPRS